MLYSNSENYYDVVVVGAGVAGFCAAVAAARHGVSVAIIEKELMPGGRLTVGGSNAIDEFNNPFRKDKKIIIKGIAW
jgi:flavin-dependent dehydrogenase